jgi:hypothetical protein
MMRNTGFAALGAAILFSFTGLPANAHSWYPTACCSSQDCEPIPSSGISEVKGGYRVSYVSERFGPIDEFVASGKVQLSTDGSFHGCWRNSGIKPRSICFFAPLNV